MESFLRDFTEQLSTCTILLEENALGFVWVVYLHISRETQVDNHCDILIICHVYKRCNLDVTYKFVGVRSVLVSFNLF